MSTMQIDYRRRLLPWDETREDRFRLWVPVILLVLVSLFLIVLIQLAPPIQPEPVQQQKIPERLAQLVIQQHQKTIELPKEKPKEVKPEEKEKEKPKPEEKKEKAPEKMRPAPTPKPTPKAEKQPTQQQVQEARHKASERVAMFTDAFQGLREIVPNVKPGGGTGAMAGSASDLMRGNGKAASIAPGRDLIAAAAGKGSGNGALVSAGHVSGKGSVNGHGNGRLAGTGSGTGGKVHSDIAAASASKGTAHTGSGHGSGQAERTAEQIRRTFDRYAGKLYSRYHAALRRNPTLQGTVVLHLIIEPSGKVKSVKVKSSQLEDDKLLLQIRLTVMMMNFGKKPVDEWEGDYSLNFFPG